MDDQIFPPEGMDDTPLDEPELEPINADQLKAIRYRKEVAARMGETTKQEKKAATDHLKAAQREAEAQRVERGEGAPSASETVRTIGSAVGAFAKVVATAFNAIITFNPIISVVIVGAIVTAIVGPGLFGTAADFLGSLGSNITNLWDTYITQPAERNANKTPITVNKTSLTNAVNIGKIIDATTAYEGLAIKTNDKGEAVCHIYYETTVNAYVDTNEIKFVIDDEKKTVTPSLPDQQIEVDTPSTGSISYFEENPGVPSEEALSICDADAKADANENQGLIACGQENLKKTIEALIEPILSGTDYTISW
ncbi:DUF4230 domain-containing protein [Paratractidigestivibacter sp.]|uniref:DUF4230 domain-containing protein n=1 Tax=Paratractidigestivibacter sp. TaxID=2847316 RepID=UPI002ACB0D03|nr:DUF4230 domain-containing protein [Paratractidigestivibacter sp.]